MSGLLVIAVLVLAVAVADITRRRWRAQDARRAAFQLRESERLARLLEAQREG